MKTCKSIQELLSAYLDRELTPADLKEVQRHLTGCAACRTEERSRSSRSKYSTPKVSNISSLKFRYCMA